MTSRFLSKPLFINYRKPRKIGDEIDDDDTPTIHRRGP